MRVYLQSFSNVKGSDERKDLTHFLPHIMHIDIKSFHLVYRAVLQYTRMILLLKCGKMHVEKMCKTRIKLLLSTLCSGNFFKGNHFSIFLVIASSSLLSSTRVTRGKKTELFVFCVLTRFVIFTNLKSTIYHLRRGFCFLAFLFTIFLHRC